MGGTQGQASDIIIAAKEIEKTKKELIEIISHHCELSYDKIYTDVDRDYWMSSEEARIYGMIDKILAKRGSKR